MLRLLRRLRVLRQLRGAPSPRRPQQTAQAGLLLETGAALLLESSPDAAGRPEYLVLESA